MLIKFWLNVPLLVHCLAKIIQGTEISEGGGWEETQNWLIAL